MFKKIFAVVCIALSTPGFSQHVIPCATDELYAYQAKQNPELKVAEQKANEMIRTSVQSLSKKANGIVYIPVVFHIIHNNGLENISQAQIMDQIRILNEDFRRKEGTAGFSTEGVASDMQIEFRLAQYDPNGNKSDGIIRVQSTKTDNADDAAKALSYWNSAKYLNIWVVKSINSGQVSGTILGYAQFPWTQSSKPTTDGVMIRSDQIGIIGTGQITQGGRTLTHEIGHWLGLYHTFQDGCEGGTSSNCASQGDQVCDTPPVAESSSGCAVGKNSCTNDVPDLNDMVRNYMDYSDGSCLNTYTAGQKARIYSMLPLYRNTIFGNGTNNVTYAGIDPLTGNYLAVPTSAIKAPYGTDFPENVFTNDGWKINNFNNPTNGWKMNSTMGYSGNTCAYMQNFSNSTGLLNARDGIQSPEIDLTPVPSPFVEFYYAYAQRSTASNDSLILFLSGDFGMNETRIFAGRGDLLSTGTTTTSEFIPVLQSEWRKVSINISSTKYTNARFRFEFVNRRGNNVYIDKFTITDGATAIKEEAKTNLQFELFPNPMTADGTLKFNLKSAAAVQITVRDISGKLISEIQNGTLLGGDHQFKISKNGIAPGMYFIDFKSDEGSFSHKMLVN